jgi:hypothetical protein
MEYFLIGSIGLIFAIATYGCYKLWNIITDGRDYSYETSYDEEGMEVETVVDWSDQNQYVVNKEQGNE